MPTDITFLVLSNWAFVYSGFAGGYYKREGEKEDFYTWGKIQLLAILTSLTILARLFL